jgi:hypothetical protein
MRFGTSKITLPFGLDEDPNSLPLDDSHCRNFHYFGRLELLFCFGNLKT